jgi:hypothetical protein
VNFRPSVEALIAPPPDLLPIAVRAFAPPPGKPTDEKVARKPRGGLASPSEWTLVFDTETTVDAAQRLGRVDEFDQAQACGETYD